MKSGFLRSCSDEKLIPSAQFKIKTGQEDYTLAVMPLQSVRARILTEVLYLTLTGDFTEEQLQAFLKDNLVSADVNDFKPVIVNLRQVYDKSLKNEESHLNLSDQTMALIVEQLDYSRCAYYHTSTSGRLNIKYFIDTYYELTVDKIEEDFNSDFKQFYEGLAISEESVGTYGAIVFYPEDILFERQTLTLEGVNEISGNMHRTFKTLKKLYKDTPHFRDNPDLFNVTRCVCGGELVARMEGMWFSTVSCINYGCYEKIGLSLADFARELNVTGLGPTTVCDLTKAVCMDKLFRTGIADIGYQDILNPDLVENMGLKVGVLWEHFIAAIERFDGSFKDLVGMVSLPYVGSSASKIVTYELLMSPNLNPNVLRQACLKGGKQDIKYVLNLWFYLPSIRCVVDLAIDSLDFRERRELPIYITNGVVLENKDGSVQSMKKNDFIDYVNFILEEKLDKSHLKVVIQSGVTRESIALIADQGTSTGSATKASRYNVPILRSAEFIELIGGGEFE